MNRIITMGPAGLPLLAACVSTPGARPQDMSAARHEATAAVAERQAEEHQAQYNPKAQAATEPCNNTGPGQAVGGACWTGSIDPWADPVNPTQVHADLAAELHKAAADHRAASRALRDAEAQACEGLSADDRDISPFAHRADIVRVEPLNGDIQPETRTLPGRGWNEPALRGAIITFRAVPGMTETWLQHVVDCHLARNAGLGHNVPEMAFCPLVPSRVTARVSSTDGGFAIMVTSDDSDTAREVLRRAQLLAPR